MQDNKWEAFSDDFESRNEYVVGRATIDEIKHRLRALKKTNSVLELGCGNGTYTDCFLRHADSILATDVSEKMVAATRSRYAACTKISVETADCANLRFADESFDTVFMANLFHIIPCKEAALKEARRVLKLNGRLIIVSITQHQMGLLNLITLVYRYKKTYGRKPPHAVKLTPSVVNELLVSAGFKVQGCTILGRNVKALYAEALNAC